MTNEEAEAKQRPLKETPVCLHPSDHAKRKAPRYLVVTYHHIENGFDAKRDYHTRREAEKAAQRYVDGTLEPDGFQYEGAVVYDQQERRYLSIYGDFPDEKAHTQVYGYTGYSKKNAEKAPSHLETLVADVKTAARPTPPVPVKIPPLER